MGSDAAPFSPDNSVDWWTNLCQCMTYKKIPFPPRDLFSNPDAARATLRSLTESADGSRIDEIEDVARDAVVRVILAGKFGSEWALEALATGDELAGFVKPAYYLTELADCVSRCNAMRPPPSVGNPLGNPGLADPGPRPEVWPIPPSEFREVAADPEPTVTVEPATPEPPPPPPPPPSQPPEAPSTAYQIAQAVGALAALGLVLFAIWAVYDYRTRNSNTSNTGGAGTYTMYWACDPRDGQCAQTMGAASGVAESGLTASACQALQQQWAASKANPMQPGSASTGGTWCSP